MKNDLSVRVRASNNLSVRVRASSNQHVKQTTAILLCGSLALGLAMPVWGQEAECNEAGESVAEMANSASRTVIISNDDCAVAENAREHGYIDELNDIKADADKASTAADAASTAANTAVTEVRAPPPEGADKEAKMAHETSVGLADAVSGQDGTAADLAEKEAALVALQKTLDDAQMTLKAAETTFATAEADKTRADETLETAKAVDDAADATVVTFEMAVDDAQGDLDNNEDSAVGPALITALREAKQDLAAAKTHATNRATAVDTATVAITTAEGEVDAAETAVTNAEGAVTTAQAPVTAAEGEVTVVQEAHDTALSDTVGNAVATAILAAEYVAAERAAAATAAAKGVADAAAAVAGAPGVITDAENKVIASEQKAARDAAEDTARAAPGADDAAITAAYAAPIMDDPATIGVDESMPTGLEYTKYTTVGTEGAKIAATVRARATVENSVAIGEGATLGASVTQTGTESDGVTPVFTSQAADNAVAIGANSRVEPEATNSVAIGADSSVTGDGGVAIGAGASAGENGIAIGAEVEAGENQIRIGNTEGDNAQTDIKIGAYDIGVIAAATENTVGTNTIGDNEAAIDAITDVNGPVSTNTDLISDNAGGIATNVTDISTNAGGIATNVTDISANGVRIDTNAGNIATNADDIETNTAGIATAVALAGLPVFKGGTGGWGIALGSFEGETAIAIGANYNLNEGSSLIRFGISTSSGGTSGTIGFGKGF